MKSLGREGISWRESRGREGERARGREGERRDRGECGLGDRNSSGSVRRRRKVGEWRVGVERKRCGGQKAHKA